MITFFKKSSDNYFVLEHTDKFSRKDIKKLSWLFSDSICLDIDNLKGTVLTAVVKCNGIWLGSSFGITFTLIQGKLTKHQDK